MSLATGQRINQQRFTLLLLPQELINAVHRIACCSPRVLDIQEIYHRPFLKDEDVTRYDPDDSTYAPYYREESKYGDDSNDTNINPPPDL